MTLSGLIREILTFLVPKGCVACGGWISAADAELVCVMCRGRLPRASWPRCGRCHHPTGTGRTVQDDCLECREWPETIDVARYAAILSHPADHLVHALKYEGWQELAGFMGREIAECLRDETSQAAIAGRRVVIVPTPTTTARVRARGYNQAASLAESVGAVLHVPVRDVVRRASGASSQTALAPEQRRENVRGVFRLGPGARSALDGATVFLVDDVLTTGATAGEVSAVLRSEGAARVVVATFARALPRVTARNGGRRAA
jgi:ComF family protein